MMKTVIRLSLVVWVVAACWDAPASRSEFDGADPNSTSHGLELRVSPIRTEVPLEGALEVEVTIRNISDSIAQFRPIFTFGGWLDAEIVGPTGSTLPKTSAIDPPNAWAVALEPGELIADTIDLRCSLMISGEIPCMAPYDLSRPGLYQIQMHFSLPCEMQDCDILTTLEARAFTVRVGR